jgi:hypothetical protein
MSNYYYTLGCMAVSTFNQSSALYPFSLLDLIVMATQLAHVSEILYTMLNIKVITLITSFVIGDRLTPSSIISNHPLPPKIAYSRS